MKYENVPRNFLIQRINELECLVNVLIKEKEKKDHLDFAWSGNLGHWYWNVKTNHIICSQLKLTTLGYAEEEIPNSISFEYFTEKLHPDDYEKTVTSMKDHLDGKTPSYKAEYRIKAKDGSWKWFFDRGVITKRDNAGNPSLLSGIVFDITDQKKLELELGEKYRQLEELSVRDDLTGLFKHGTILKKVEEEISHAMENNTKLSILMLDMDDFKKVNDTYGHQTGDIVLSKVSNEIKRNSRKTDIAGRYGGEEFLLILPNSDLKEALNVAERIKSAVESLKFDKNVKVTISGGLKEYSTETPLELIELADRLLYTAKKNGKNMIAR